MLAEIDDSILATLPDHQRTALEVALLRCAPEGRPLDPRLVATALLTLVRRLTELSPVLLAVDDAQWLDAPTSTALAFAARRLEREPVGVLCAFRPHPGGLGLLESLPRERVRRVAIGPLPLGALGPMIREQLGWSLPRPLLARIAQASRGNPFYALEVARLVPRESDPAHPAPGARLPVPDDVRTLAASRVATLPPPTQAALLRAAVLAEPTVRTIEPEALAPAEEVGIVGVDERGRIAFSHPLFAAAIYASASTAQRREANRVAAAEVSDPEQRARHLADGADGPDPAVAAELDAAAELAHSRGAPDAAAELTEVALRLTEPHDLDVAGDREQAADRRAQRLLRGAWLHVEAGGHARAAELLAELLSGPAPDRLRAQGLRLRATLESHGDSFTAALGTALEALEPAAGDPSLAAAIELDVAFYLVGVGDVGGALRHAEAAVGRAELPGGDPAVLADALAVVTMVGFLSGDDQSPERLHRALALEDPDRQRSLFTSPRFIAGLVMLWTGRVREALQLLLKLRAERMELGVEGDIPMFSLYLVWAYLWLGETEHAAEIAAADSAAVALLGDRGLASLTLSASALVDAQRGEIESARNQANLALSALTGLEWWTGTVWPRWALGFAELSAGDPAAAHAALEPLTATLPSLGLADPAGLVFVPDEIEALIALGELDRAQPLIELLRRLGEASDRPWAIAAAARGRGILATARGDLDEAIEALQEALAAHDRVEMPFERGRTLLAMGRACRRRKQWSPARTALRQAVTPVRAVGGPAVGAGGPGGAGPRRRAERRRSRRAVGDRAAGGGARRLGTHQSGGRRAGVLDRQGGGGEPDQGLPQARDPLPRRAGRRTAPRGPAGRRPPRTAARVVARRGSRRIDGLRLRLCS